MTGARRGFSLVETMLAGALLTLVTLALFEAVITGARIVHENSEALAADALAWDSLWKRFNEDFDSSYRAGTLPFTREETVTSNRMSVLWYPGSPAKLVTVVSNSADRTGRVIDVNVEWGPSSSRKSLMPRTGAKSFNHPVRVYRSLLGRVNPNE